MKHFIKQKTLFQGIAVAVLVSFIASLVTPVMVSANSFQFDELPPIINHRPFSLVVEGETLLISALVGDDFGIKRVVLKIFNATGATEGDLPKIESEPRVPVNIRILALNAPVYNRPGGAEIAQVGQGERLDVYRVRDNYYLIKIPNGGFGYIDAAETEVIYSGFRYGAQIPIEYIKGNKFQYQIIVTDESDNQTVTDRYSARIVTKEKYLALQKKLPQLRSGMESEGAVYKGMTQTPSGSHSASTLWLLAGAAAIGGGVAIYYATTTEKSSEKQGTADVRVDW